MARRATDGADTAIAPPDPLQPLRKEFLDRLWTGMLVLALLGTPISVLRTELTGWQPVYIMHVVIGIAGVLLYFAREHIPFNAKTAIMIGFYWAIGVTGLFTLGLMGAGVWFLVMSGLLMSTFFSPRAGLITALVTAALIMIAAWLFTSGTLPLPFDANIYATSVAGWATLLVATSVMPVMVFSAISAYQKTIVELLHEVQAQRDQIAEQAARDSLTGLPLSTLANDRLQMKMHAAVRNRRKVAVCFVDLNGFKRVNDTLGHAAGDQLLQSVAGRLMRSVRSKDTVARIGGDEFLILLGDLNDRYEVAPVAQKMIDAVCSPYSYESQTVRLGASVGIAIFPEDAADINTLRRLADRAMYQVKRDGKSGYIFADPSVPLSEIPLTA